MLRKILVAVVAALAFMLPASAADKTWQPEIKIGILSGVNRVEIKTSAPCTLVDAVTGKVLKKIAAEQILKLSANEITNSVEIRGEKVSLEDLTVAINGKKYFGGVRLDKKNNSLTVINLAPVEEYLRGVVPEEMPLPAQAEALKAQAVAARSFALKNRNRHSADGYDLCAKIHCQVYGGADSARSESDKAITETRGVVLEYGGKIVDANFHADSGGWTESVAEVWGTAAPYLQAVEDAEKHTRHWTKEFTAADFASKLGSDFGNLKKVKLSKLKVGKAAKDRSRSGRVKTAQLVGTKKTVQLTGTELRSKFALPSTLFSMKFSKGKVIFEGYGYGHGVGMAQNGANAYAKKGWNYEKILLHYYKGTALKDLY